MFSCWGVVGGYMFIESIQAMRKTTTSTEAVGKESVYSRLIKSLPFQSRFDKSGIELSVLLPPYSGVFLLVFWQRSWASAAVLSWFP